MKTFKFSLVLRTRENTDVFISLDDNIYGIHSKRINILYVWRWAVPCSSQNKIYVYVMLVVYVMHFLISAKLCSYVKMYRMLLFHVFIIHIDDVG